MLTINQNLLDAFQRGSVNLAAFVGIVTFYLSDEQSSQTDWQAGTPLGTPGTDFPATTLNAALLIGGTTATVVNSEEFTVGSAANPGYLILSSGANFEVVSYTGSTGTTFTGLTRGLWGTAARAWSSGDDVYQITYDDGTSPDFDLEIQQKNWTQPDASGGPPSVRMGAKMVYRSGDGCYYLFGGYDQTNYLQDLWKFDPSTDTWTDITPASGNPPARAYHGMVFDLVGGQLIVCGGYNGAAMNDVYKYDFGTSSWSTDAAWNMPAARYKGMAAGYIDNGNSFQLLYTGGYTAMVGLTNATWTFDGGSWSTRPNAGYNWALGDACWMSVEGGVFVVAHAYNNGTVSGFFDISFNQWFHAPDVANPPVLRYQPTLVYDDVNHEALMFGGYVDIASGGTSDLYHYNKSSNVWGTLDSYSREGRERHVAAWNSDNHEMCVWGGIVNAATPTWPSYTAPMRFRYFWQTAKFRTQALDMAAAPTVNGFCKLEDVTDIVNNTTGITYNLDYSDDASSWTDIGDMLDGDEVSALHRYYRYDITMTNDGLNQSPRVKLADVSFDIIEWFAFSPVRGADADWGDVFEYAPIVSKISGLSSKVDPVKAAAKIGSVAIDLVNTGGQAEKLITNYYPRNNTVYIKVGVADKGFSASDFELAYKGRIADWSIGKDVISFKTTDFLGDLKKEIPEEDAGGTITALVYNNAGIAPHPVDIIEDIVRNQVGIADRDVDLVSFDVAVADSSLSGWKFNRTLTDPEDAYGLTQKLCRHIAAVLIPRENGKIAIKIMSASDDPVDAWDERLMNFSRVRFNGRGDSIRNYISTWWHNDGLGEEYTNWEGIEVSADADSISNWGQKTLRTKSLWLGDNDATYDGQTRASDISARILALAKNGVQAVQFVTSMNAYPVQVGDVVRIQSSVVTSFEEYMRWVMEMRDARPRPDIYDADNCEVADWSVTAQGSAPTLDPDFYIQGANSIALGKSGTTGALVRCTKNITSVDATGKSAFIWLYLVDKTELTNSGTAIDFRWRTSTGAYYKITKTQAELSNGWNKIGGDLTTAWTATGSPDITDLNSLFLKFNTLNAADTIAHGNIKMDHWSLVGADKDFVGDRKRYSIPYNVYGAAECIDMKWWAARKQVDFTRGLIKWELRRAREVPLTKQFTSQADFYNGYGENIDLETTNSSVQIADNGGSYYSSALYNIIIDMGQQPEQAGTWTLSDTQPAGTGVSYQAWVSETGHFKGEEVWLGPVQDADAINIKARFYRVQALLSANAALSSTPTVDEITANFANG